MLADADALMLVTLMLIDANADDAVELMKMLTLKFNTAAASWAPARRCSRC